MDVVLNGNCQQSVSIIKNINEINDLQLSTAQMELSTVFLVNSISMGGEGGGSADEIVGASTPHQKWNCPKLGVGAGSSEGITR